MPHSAILNFTAAGPETLIQRRGSQSWKLNPVRAREAKFLVCVQNRKGKEGTRGDGSEPHGEAFFVGHVADVVRVPKEPTRWRIAISDYARIKIPDAWKGWRFPVRYTTLEELGIDVDDLQFTPLPDPQEQGNGSGEKATDDEFDEVHPLTIELAKAGLAAHYKVKPEAIKITIEW